MDVVGNLFLFPAVKGFWKSVNNWQSYCHELVYYFWGDTAQTWWVFCRTLAVCCLLNCTL